MIVTNQIIMTVTIRMIMIVTNLVIMTVISRVILTVTGRVIMIFGSGVITRVRLFAGEGQEVHVVSGQP